MTVISTLKLKRFSSYIGIALYDSRASELDSPPTSAQQMGHAIEGVQREQGHRMVGVESAVIALTERIAELERDNMRLRGTVSVESQRVDRL
ncbi:hypothetical protein Tco_1467626 [Tanacetum coccineum]